MKNLDYLKETIAAYEAGDITESQFDPSLGLFLYSRPDVIPYTLKMLDIERNANKEAFREEGNVMSMAFSFVNPEERLTKSTREVIFNKFKEVFDKYTQFPLNYLVKGYERKKD